LFFVILILFFSRL